MTYEEMQKTMQFILEQQAQFTANIQKLQESQAKTEGKVNELEDLVTRLAAATVAGFKDVNAKIDALVDAQIRTEETLSAKISALVDAQRRTDEKIDALAESQRQTSESVKKTDEAVRNLTAAVDRYFNERRNGG